MSEPKFTKWPWYSYFHDYKDCLDEYYTEYGVSSSVNKRGICIILGADSEEEQMANANVMSAAPEMYEILEKILESQCRRCRNNADNPMYGGRVSCDSKNHKCPFYMDDVKKILAKARGEQ